MLRDYRNSNGRERSAVPGIAESDIEDEDGDQVMQLAALIQDMKSGKTRSASNENGVNGALFGDRKAKSYAVEMTLHLPCYVAGRTPSGSRWKGKTKTVALSRFGAHLLLPTGVDLEPEISIIFRIPKALKVLFSRDVFRVKAEIHRSDMEEHWLAPSGEKVVGVAFSHPLRFATWPRCPAQDF